MGSCFCKEREVRHEAPPPYLPRRPIPSSARSSNNQNVVIITTSLPQRQREPTPENYYYGKFRCGTCRHHWVSRRTWLSGHQLCENCHTSAKPYFTRPLKEAEKSTRVASMDPDKAHKNELCSKCRESGGDCRRFRGKNSF